MVSTPVGSKKSGANRLHNSRLMQIFFACAATLLVMVAFGSYEAVYLGRRVIAEGPPEFGIYFLCRTAALMGCAGLIVFMVQRASQLGPKPNFDHIGAKMRKAILASAVLGIAFSILFLLSPKEFFNISVEDDIVEWASAAALFLGSVCALQASARAYVARSKFEAITLLGFAGLLFLICMEEVSWLQRVIGYQTPYWLSDNWQGEANFHNVSTNVSENVYYVGAFCFLIALPFANDSLRLISHPRWFVQLLPTRKSALVAAPMAGYTWDMWNIIPIQMTVILTVFVLIGYAAAATKYRDPARNVILISLIATLLPLAVFFCFGDAQVRSYDTTEYKELFIALGLLSAALAMAFGRQSGSKVEPIIR